MSPHPASTGCLRHTLSHLSHSFQCSCASSPGPSLAVRFPVESGCKDTTFFQTAKIFFRFFSKFFLTPLSDSRLEPRFFSFFLADGPGTAPQNPARSPVFPENRLPVDRFFPISLQLAVYLSFNAFRDWTASFLRAVSQRVAGHSRAGRAAPPALLPRPSSAGCSPVVPHLFLICSFFIGQMVRQQGREWTAGSEPAPLREGDKKISGAGPMAPLRENRKT